MNIEGSELVDDEVEFDTPHGLLFLSGDDLDRGQGAEILYKPRTGKKHLACRAGATGEGCTR